MNVMDMVALDCEYRLSAVKRECAMKTQAKRYEAEFERAYARREERRRADTKQWQDVILPRIKNEATMLRYERGLEHHATA